MKRRKNFWNGWLIFWGSVILFFLIVNTAFFFLCTSSECSHNFLLTKVLFKVFLFITAIVCIIYHFVDYRTINKMDDKSVKMKFNNFKDTYCVNPNRWYMQEKDGRLKYKYDEGWYTKCYYVTFSYFDWLKFLCWKISHEHNKRINNKRKKERECDERMIDMLECIQKDINVAYEKIVSIKVE